MESESVQPPVIVIVGETASGKTAVSIQVAQKIDGEIICADSRTVYKHLNIGTAKPTEYEQKLVRHHLINIIEPDQSFNAAQFQRLAKKCIQEINNRGKIPILAGGTGLYVDSVLYNFQFSSVPNPELRLRLEQMNDEQLTTELLRRNIHLPALNTKNRRHVIRALERGGDTPKQTKIRTNTLILGLQLDKELLKKRITERVEQMFNEGLVEEARTLFDRYGDIEALRTPGYKAVRQYMSNKITLDEAKAAFIAADIALAKRQRTWFKRNPHINWFSDPKELMNKAVEFSAHLPYN